jgi:hypothetical protein
MSASKIFAKSAPSADGQLFGRGITAVAKPASAAGFEPFGNIATRWASWPNPSKIEDEHALGDAVQRLGHLLDVLAPGLIVVAEDDDISTAQESAVRPRFSTPAARGN